MSVAQKRILALDVGDARTGVAISDPLGMFAQPLETIEGAPNKILTPILEIIKRDNVGSIVVGLPIELSGEHGPQAAKVQAFVDKLRKRLESDPILTTVQVSLLDERLTTKQAERVIQGSKLKNKQRSAALDRVSAALILESYLLSR